MKKLITLLALATVINAAFFYFRDNFQYVKYSTYKDLYSGCDEKCRQKWDHFSEANSPAVIREAQQLLKPLRLDTAGTLSRITAIGHHLYARFHSQAGIPGDRINWANPVEKYKLLSADTSQKLWCGTYAQMFSLFCFSQGILTRNVEIFKPGDHHVLNECYIPERQQWLMVDLTNNILFAEKNGKLLNTQDFVSDRLAPAFLSILTAGTLQLQSFSLFEQKSSVNSYYKTAYPFYYYHQTDTKIVYRPSAKLKRYFLPDYWYEIFSPTKKTTTLFYAKAFFAVLWLILLTLVILKIFNK